jgi:hypothetical protein
LLRHPKVEPKIISARFTRGLLACKIKNRVFDDQRFANANHSLVTTVFAITALAISSSIGLAADCPTPPPNHIPAAPTSELNIDSIKSLLLEYHQNYYDLDVAAVFETVQNYLQRNAGLSKRPAVVLDCTY